MTAQKKDNTTDALTYLLKSLGIKFTDAYLIKELRSHPFYPSLAAISDILQQYNIKNEALKLTYDDLAKFEPPFIAHLKIYNGIFVVVQKVTKKEVTYHFEAQTSKTISKGDFISIWDNIVLIAYPTDLSIEPNFKQNYNHQFWSKTKLPLLLFLLMLLLTIQLIFNVSALQILPLLVTKAIGLFFVSLLIKHELGIHSEMADKLCSMTKSAGCNEVLNSKASKLIGNVFLADVGLIWLISTSIVIFFNIFSNNSNGLLNLNLLGWLAICSVPFILFSISYQAFVIKKYCPLCLGVMSALLIDALLFLTYYNFRFQLPSLPETLFMFGLVAIVVYVWFMHKENILKIDKLKDSEIEFLHLKRNPDVIQWQLEKSEEVNVSAFPNPIRITNYNSSTVITEIINLYCSPCKKAFEKIDQLLNNDIGNKPDVQIVLYCMVDPSDELMTKTTSHMLSLAEKLSATEMYLAFFDWFSMMDYKKWSQKYTSHINDLHASKLKKNEIWYLKNQIQGTPTAFIGTKKIPAKFDITDIQYLIN